MFFALLVVPFSPCDVMVLPFSKAEVIKYYIALPFIDKHYNPTLVKEQHHVKNKYARYTGVPRSHKTISF